MEWKQTGNSYCAEFEIDGKAVVYFLIYDNIKSVELFVQLPPTKGFVKQKRAFLTVEEAKDYAENSTLEEVL